MRIGVRWLDCAIAPRSPLPFAQKIPDVRNTKHNLSVTGPGPREGASESQVCVFCHTPHGAEKHTGRATLESQLNPAQPTRPYTSSSIEANAAELANGPGGSSKLCLSCHDGTMAIGNINVLNGQSPATFALAGTGAGGTMPQGREQTRGLREISAST